VASAIHAFVAVECDRGSWAMRTFQFAHVVDGSCEFMPRLPSHLATSLQTFARIKMYFIGPIPFVTAPFNVIAE
jgi:hypothetical protein